MNHQNKHLFANLKSNMSPNQFRLVRIAPFILALFVLVNFTFTNLQYEANKPILEKYDDPLNVPLSKIIKKAPMKKYKHKKKSVTQEKLIYTFITEDAGN